MSPHGVVVSELFSGSVKGLFSHAGIIPSTVVTDKEFILNDSVSERETPQMSPGQDMTGLRIDVERIIRLTLEAGRRPTFCPNNPVLRGV